MTAEGLLAYQEDFTQYQSMRLGLTAPSQNRHQLPPPLTRQQLPPNSCISDTADVAIRLPRLSDSREHLTHTARSTSAGSALRAAKDFHFISVPPADLAHLAEAPAEKRTPRKIGPPS